MKPLSLMKVLNLMKAQILMKALNLMKAQILMKALTKLIDLYKSTNLNNIQFKHGLYSPNIEIK